MGDSGSGSTPTVTIDEFVDIDTLGKLDLPTLPILKQEKDWKQWWNSVTAYFEVLELDNFLIRDIPEPQDPEKRRKWLKCRRFIMVHLLKALSLGVQKDMEILGWDIKNPYNTIEIARKAVTKVSGDSLRQLLDSWNRLNAKRHQNLKEFIQHVQQLRETLQNHGHKIEDNTAILNTLSAIEFVDPSWVHLLEHDYNSGNLTWAKLTSLCVAKGNMQATRNAYAATTGTSAAGEDSSNEPRNRPSTKYDDSIKCGKCGKVGYNQEDCWDCNGVPREFRSSPRGRGGNSRGRGGRNRGGFQGRQNRQNESEPNETPPSAESSKESKDDSNGKSKVSVSEGLMTWRTGNMALRNDAINERDTWIADTGCDGPVANDMKWYVDFVEFAEPRRIGGHSSEPTLAWGTGTVMLPTLRPGGRSELELRDVWFAPS